MGADPNRSSIDRRRPPQQFGFVVSAYEGAHSQSPSFATALRLSERSIGARWRGISPEGSLQVFPSTFAGFPEWCNPLERAQNDKEIARAVVGSVAGGDARSTSLTLTASLR